MLCKGIWKGRQTSTWRLRRCLVMLSCGVYCVSYMPLLGSHLISNHNNIYTHIHHQYTKSAAYLFKRCTLTEETSMTLLPSI
uniref:Uncharacterized protein n=1 Tax=Cannabis sativa TaxID=3483 RepID=A0A803QY46_CANSA